MSTSHVRAVQERRRSNAAGLHSARSTRATQLAAALGDWADEDVPDEAVAAVFAALDPDREVYKRDAEEVAEVRTALAAAAPHLIAAHQIRTATEEH